MDRVRRAVEKHSLEALLLVIIVIGGLGSLALASDSAFNNFLQSQSDSTVAHYRLDEGAGRTAYDTAGDNDGTLNNFDFNATSGWTEGKYGKALRFDGNDDYVEVGDVHDFAGNQSFTVSLWYNHLDLPSSTWERLVSKEDNDASGRQGWLVVRDSNNYNEIQFEMWRDGSGFASVNLPVLTNNSWHHAVFTYDGETLKGYHNGELVATDTASAESLKDHPQPLRLGEHSTGGNNAQGIIDDVRIYTAAFNASQVRSLHNRGSLQVEDEGSEVSDKVLEMEFDHWNSTHILDTSGTNNHGQSQNGSTQRDAVKCKVGRCYEFNGGGNIPLLVNYTFFPNGVTAMAWIKTNSGGNILSYDRSEIFRFEIGGTATSGHVGWSTDNSSDITNDMESAGTVDDGRWHHVAATYDPSTSKKKIFIDGVHDSTVNWGGGDQLGDGTSRYGFIGHGSGASVYNGSRCCGYFDGYIDQVKMFDRALSQQEIIDEAHGLNGGGAVLDLRFDTGTGGVAHDVSANGNDGTLEPNETEGPQWTEGISGSALAFSGRNDTSDTDSVALSQEVTLNMTGATVSFWANKKTGNYERVFSQAKDSVRAFIEMDLNEASGDSTFKIEPDVNNAFVLNPSTGRDIEGKWHHFVLSFYQASDGSAAVKLYLDGRLVDDYVDTGNWNDTLSINYIGYQGRQTNFVYGEFFNGTIDEVKMFPYNVSVEKVRQLYRRGASQVTQKNEAPENPGTFGLVGYWSLGKGNGTHTFDSSGNVNHGQLVNGPVEENSAACRSGRCLGFDGSNDYVNVSDDDRLDIDSGDLSVSTWVKVPEGYTPPNHRIIVEKAVDEHFHTADGPGWGVSIDASGQVYGGVTDAAGSNKWETDKFTDIRDGKWHHAVMVINNSNNITMYLDGRQEDKTPFSEAAKFNPDAPLGIGASANSETRHIKADIDEVRVYNRSLSEEEVWSLYTRGRDNRDSEEMAGPVAWWRLDQYGREKKDAIEGRAGTWNNTRPAEETRYIVNEDNAGRGLSVAGYSDGTTVAAGICSKTIEAGEVHTFSSTCYSPSDTVTSSGPFSAHFQDGGADGPVPRSFVGTEFVSEDCRDPEYFNVVALSQTANVDIKNATQTVASFSVGANGHTEVNTDVPSGSVYTIESDNPILVTYDRGNGDKYMLHPASKHRYGMMEEVMVSKDATDVTVYNSSGMIETSGVYNKFDKIGSLDQGRNQGGSKSYHVVANQSAISGKRCADADNSETDIGISKSSLGKEFRLPEPMSGVGNNDGDRYLTITTSDAGTCTVYRKDGSKAGEKSATNSDPYPGFITFDTWNDFNLTEAGAKVKCTAPSAVQWEPSDYEGEANLYGMERLPDGMFGNALGFNGRDDWVNVTRALSLEGREELTMTAWVNPSEDHFGGVIQQYASGEGNATFELNHLNNRKWRGQINWNLEGYSFCGTPENVSKIGEWQHVGAVFDSGKNVSKVYVNGRLEANCSGVSTIASVPNPSLSIGSNPGGGTEYFNGTIDDVRIYPYALTHNQIRRVMNGGGVRVG